MPEGQSEEHHHPLFVIRCSANSCVMHKRLFKPCTHPRTATHLVPAASSVLFPNSDFTTIPVQSTTRSMFEAGSARGCLCFITCHTLSRCNLYILAQSIPVGINTYTYRSRPPRRLRHASWQPASLALLTASSVDGLRRLMHYLNTLLRHLQHSRTIRARAEPSAAAPACSHLLWCCSKLP